MRNFVQVAIPEKLYNVILEICKIEPGVKTDRLLPEDLIEQCISSALADKLDTYVRDPVGCEVGEKAIYANIAYKEEWWKDHKEKYPSKDFLCIWDAVFPEDEEETE